MKKHIYIIAMSMVSVLVSCDKDFLERVPLGFVTPENFTSENDILSAVNGAYKVLSLDLRHPVYLDFFTDNGFIDRLEVEMWDQVQNSESPMVETKWNNNYRGIIRANTVINNIDKVPLSAERRNRYLSEVLFLRAYFYGDLIDFYGDVPYRTEVSDISKKDLARTDKERILDDMLNDLDTAAKYLPPRYDAADVGRATKGAALALKARLALYGRRWEVAASAAKEVIALDEYSLYEDYAGIFAIDNENNKEVIFDIQYLTNQNSNRLSNNWYRLLVYSFTHMALANLEREYYMANGKSIEDPTSGYNPQNPWVNRDPRLAVTLTLPHTFDGYNATTGAERLFIPNTRRNVNFTSLRIRKWVDYNEFFSGGLANSNGTNIILLRYTDILLMRAEALLELPDWEIHKEEIVSLVDQIRQRPTVMMPKVGDVEGNNLTRNQLIDIVRHERRVEFAFEGTRTSDIKRWDIGAVAYSDGLGYRPELIVTREDRSVYQLYPFRQRSFNVARNYLWPIPLSEILANKAISGNNLGY